MIDRDVLLAGMRCAKLRIALLGTEIDTLGVALKRDLITIDAAITALDELDAWPFLIPEIEREYPAP
jgi:hypothetical protein